MAPDNFSNILQNFNDLNKEWHSERPDLVKCGHLLTQLKVSILAVAVSICIRLHLIQCVVGKYDG